MSRSQIKVVGLQKTKRKIASRGKSIVRSVKAGVNTETEAIFKESQKLVPVLTGALKRSGRHHKPVVENDGTSIIDKISYGDSDNVNYAVIVHEDLQVHHRNGVAKYLQIPRNRFVKGIGKRIGARIGKILSK